jgi:ankyrin repeat protein
LIAVLYLVLIISRPEAGEIHDLVSSGEHSALLKVLDEDSALINELDDQHRTPLYLAAENGNLEMVTFLLSRGADHTTGDADNSQPIHLAALGGFTDIVESLISRGGNINAQDNNGTTPLIFALSYRKQETADWLIENGADIGIANAQRVTPLHYAVIRDYTEIIDGLLERQADVNAVDQDGETPLHYAAQMGKIEIAERLIEHGADLEKRNAYGRTPLLLTARESGSTEMARFLADRGADINASDESNDTPLTLAAWRGFKTMVDFLLDRGATLPVDENIKNELINSTADRGLTRLFRTIIDAGWDIDIQSQTGGSLLHQAAGGGSDSIVMILLEYGQDVNRRDRYGRTPLHYAAEFGREGTTGLLISRGADANLRSLAGWTPFNVAVQFNRDSTVVVLKRLGVDTSEIQFPRLSGPYLGQSPPESQPEMFAVDIVSTNQFEHGCVTFTPDGQELYWTSSIRPSDSGYITGLIMTSRIENGRWTVPQIAEFSGIVTRDDIPVISPDGRRLFFLSRRGPHGMWYVERAGSGWSEPRYIEGGPNDHRPYWQFSVTAGGNIFFSSRGDIYLSKPVDGGYSVAEKLGATINTAYGEGQVCVAPDESFMIFGASHYPDSLGGDGFRISYRDSSGSWSTPAKLESDGEVLHGICPVLSPDGKYLFFNNMNTGTTDIYWLDAGFIDSVRQR